MSSLANLLNQETIEQPAAPSSSALQTTPLRGTGGGLADLIPTELSNVEGDDSAPAALSEGEFVWPADVVSMLGDGSSEAGARILNKLMATIREKKQGKGNKKQAKSIADLME